MPEKSSKQVGVDIDLEELGTLIGSRVKEARLQSGWSISQLARESGRDRTHISGLEAGQHDNPGVKMVFALAAALQVSPQYLMGLDNFSGLIVEGLEDLPEPLQEVVRIAGGLSAGRQSELRFIARALAAAEDAELGSVTRDLEVQQELLQALYKVGGERLLTQFFQLVGFPDSVAGDVERMRLRLGF